MAVVLQVVAVDRYTFKAVTWCWISHAILPICNLNVFVQKNIYREKDLINSTKNVCN